MKRTFATVFCLAALIGLVAGSAVAGEGWTKLGSRTLLLHDGSDTVKIKSDAEVSEIVLQVKKHQVLVQDLEVVFADGTSKAIEVNQKLRPGIDSEPIDLGMTGALEKVTLMVEGSRFVAADRIPTTVLGK